MNLLLGRYAPDQRFSSNTSTDSTRYASSNRSMSETRMFQQQPASGGGGGGVVGNVSTATGNTSNRNSIKESNSNRSSMDVSTCSYNTLIIHDDNMYSIGGRDYSSPADMNKKDRPHSYGDQVMI